MVSEFASNIVVFELFLGDAFGPGSSVPTPHCALLIEAALHSGVSTAIPIAESWFHQFDKLVIHLLFIRYI
jgi:hypothetical protein